MSEAQRMGRNFVFVTASQVIAQVLTFVVSVSVARDLGVQLYGLFVFGFAFPSWFLWLVSFELDSVVAIEVAADKTKAGSYLTAVTLLRIPFALVAIVLLIVSAQLVISDPFARAITLILGAASILATYASVYRTMFRAFERLEFVALTVIVERAIATAAILLLLVFRFGLLQIALVYVFTSMVAALLSLAILKSRFVWFTLKIEFTLMMAILKRAVPFAMAGVATTFLYSTGPLLATILGNSEATGEFNAAFALVLAFLAPLSVYYIVVLPTFSRMHRERPEAMNAAVHKSQKLFFMFGLPAALGGAFFADRIMTFVYGSAFADSARSFEILILVIATATISIGLGAALAAAGRQKLNLAISVAGMACNVVLCFALIPSMGPVGAAWAFLAAQVVMVIPTWIAVRRELGSLHIVDIALRPLLAGSAMILVLIVLPSLSLFTGIGIGAAVYFVALLAIGGITREDWGIIKEIVRGTLVRGEGSISNGPTDSSDAR